MFLERSLNNPPPPHFKHPSLLTPSLSTTPSLPTKNFDHSLNKLAISNHTALILGVHTLRSYLKLICKYELHSLPNKKVNGAKDHGKNYIKVGPPLVRHLLRDRLLLLLEFGNTTGPSI